MVGPNLARWNDKLKQSGTVTNKMIQNYSDHLLPELFGPLKLKILLKGD